MGFSAPKPAAAPPPPVVTEDPKPSPVDPAALENARKRADDDARRKNRSNLQIPLGGITGGTGLSI